MGFMRPTADGSENASGKLPINDNVRSAIVVVIGAAGLMAIAFGTMMMLTSPDGWVMKAANQAMTTAQQGTLASYNVADAQ
jgi:hypothetical protein